MDRNSRPGDLRRAEDSPASSPGGFRPVEGLGDQRFPRPPRRAGARRRNELGWADFMEVLPPHTRIHAQTIYDTYRRLDAGRVMFTNYVSGRSNDRGNPRDHHVDVPAYRLALRHVDIAFPRMIAEMFFPDLFQPASRRAIADQILNRLTATNLSSMLLEASQTGTSSISCAVCFEEYVESDTVIILPCHPSHRFHRICLRDWAEESLPERLTCPICRAPLRTTSSQERDSSPPAAS
ncbi:hypothetical protein PCANC_03666 [Puccinia coronata f. sp. avenae]|uniref:RING-type domain-containing protein n=1 Tax=Puccinia coronata f. sp. avenae TaxID=200324 RepID=A0A2N5VXM3_9BASI|nr:hypothetical protein PCANC_03666 [Puccinia coronata f. sp. avenae]